MKNLFFTVRKRWYILLVCAVFFISGLCFHFCKVAKVVSPNFRMSIIIDAGHGGLDVK